MNQLFHQLRGKYKNLKHFFTSLFETIKAGYPARNLIVIGVTGTDGKTTTAHLIYEILKAAGRKTALVSTVAAYIGDKVLDTGLHTTTPDATVLQPLLKRFLRQGVKYVVLEVTSHGLDQHRVFGCNFWAGVLTNVTHEHLDYHKTFENYRATKAKLFRGVKAAVLNKDDKSFKYFKQKVGNAKVVTYGLKDNPDIKAVNIQTTTNGTSFTIDARDEKQDFKTKLFAEYNVSNILAAASLARLCNIPWTTIIKTASSFNQIPGRMEFIQKKPFSVVVDFAHTPNGLKNALDLLRHLVGKKGRVIAVFGSAGERDKEKREMMGRISGKIADVSIFTAEDPRSEDLYKILEQMASGAQKAGLKEGQRTGKWFVRIPERGEAIAFALQKIARPGDCVGIFGKGHEKSLAYDHMEHPWSDKEFVKFILQSNKQQAAIVLAAGKGTRMQSETPKVLHKIAGRPMIAYPLENLRRALFGEIVVVVGYKKEEVIKEVWGLTEIAVQPQPLGNAHAVSYGLKKLKAHIKNVMVVQGDDSAFYKPSTFAEIFEKHKKAGAKITLATIFKDNPGKLGVVKRDAKGNILGIEHWNGEGKTPGSGEINCGLWVFDRSWLEKTLPKIKKNEKGEYYLTDVIPIAVREKVKVQTVKISEDEWVGVNTPEELTLANQKMAEKLSFLYN